MTIEKTLQKEVEESKKRLCRQNDDNYKRDLEKRIELIEWVLENINNPDISIYDLVESRINETISTVNQT